MGIVAIIVLLLVFATGMRRGLGRDTGALVAHFIAIPLAGISYELVASLFSFISSENWQSVVGFFATKYLIILILYLVFIRLSHRFIGKTARTGRYFRLAGGLVNSLNSAMGMVTLYLAIQAFPVGGWVERVMLGSGFLDWLAGVLIYVKAMLPFA
jgi:uncharacterized membrane protein required for colicin V production